MEETEGPEAALFPDRVGDRLRTARMAAGYDLSDIATKTRVPLRHLKAIESGDYSSFPSATYCIGFVKAYARVVGEDEVALGRDVRAELGGVQAQTRAEIIDANDADLVSLPGKTLAWTAAVIAILLAIGYGVWRNQLFNMPAAETYALAPAPVVAPAPAPSQVGMEAATPNPAGLVVLTAKELVWLRIYDANDKVLFEKEMAAGETFPVPADADNPQIRTGRADLIAVTIDGREVEALGPAERTIKDVGVSARALTNRAAAATPLTEAVSQP